MASAELSAAAKRVWRLLESEDVLRLIEAVDNNDLLSELKYGISPLLHWPDTDDDDDEGYWDNNVRGTLNDTENFLESLIYESASGLRLRKQVLVGLADKLRHISYSYRMRRTMSGLGETREREIRAPKEEDFLEVKELVLAGSYLIKNSVELETDEAVVLEFLFDDASEMNVLVVRGYDKEKTVAFARSVFDSDRVRTHFQRRFWTNMPLEGLDYRMLYENRCLCLINADIDFDTYDNICRSIPNYFSVDWRYASGSKVLIFNPNWNTFFCPVYYLGKPALKDTRDIFYKMAFGVREAQEWHAEVRRECEVLHFIPMMVVAGTLYFEESEAECDDFVRKVTWQKEGGYILKTCYNRLPTNLKHCFAYSSLFPRGYEIDVQTLVRLWMAQGFIDGDDEDVGYGYFLNLLRRFFFYEAKVDAIGRVTSCLMHPYIYNLSRDQSCRNCSIITYEIYGEFDPSHVLFCMELDLLSKVYDKPVERMRSFLLPTWKIGNELCRDWDKLIAKCESLRALDIRGLVTHSHLQSIDKLMYLRYLDLSHNNNLKELPNSISGLLYLQTLRLSSCFKLRQLPKDIGNLVNLRHLEMDGLVSLPRGFGRLANLQTMPEFMLSNDASTANKEVKELKQLHNLHVLRIKNLRHGMHDFLDGFKRLRSLSIEWEYRDSRPGDKKIMLMKTDQFNGIEEMSLSGCRDLNYMFCQTSFPKNLKKLSLKRCKTLPILPSLDQCVYLRMLVLDDMPDLEYVMEALNEGILLSLQEVWLMELRELKGWSFPSSLPLSRNVSSFARLLRLVIEDCPKFSSFPLFPTLTEGLLLDSTSWGLFEQTVKHQAMPNPIKASSSSPKVPSTPLSKLKNMSIVAIKNFDNSKAKGIPWETLESLGMLKFDFLPKLEALPKELVQVKGLRELHIWRCGVKELPSWIEKLEHLEKLVIRVCPDLRTLPEEMKILKSLKTLEIQDCTILLRRCEKEIGMDWCKIAHIPHIKLGQISITKSSS